MIRQAIAKIKQLLDYLCLLLFNFNIFTNLIRNKLKLHFLLSLKIFSLKLSKLMNEIRKALYFAPYYY